MKRLTVYMLLMLLALGLTACAGSKQSGDNAGNEPAYQGPLTGSWTCVEQGVHGNTLYVWSFGEDGRFAYLCTAYEPPQGSGDIKSSVRERFFRGKFSETDGTIECYEVKFDDYFTWGDKWRYFPDRDPALLAEKLFETKLKKSKNADDFTMSFEITDTATIRIAIDRGDPFEQYDMEFVLIP